METKRSDMAERAEHERRKREAEDVIEKQEERGKAGHPPLQQKIDDQQLINEMRVNKASVDLNRALDDYNKS